MTAATTTRAEPREEALTRLGSAFKGALGAVRRLRGRDTHRPGELSFAQYHLLFALAERGDLTTGDLALAADLAPATVTQMLDSLASMGLVERTRSERDRRVVTCSITLPGSELTRERRAHFEQTWHARLAAFSTAELETAAAVVECLRELYESLDAEAHRSP